MKSTDYLIVDVRASVHAATAGLVFFTRRGTTTPDLEQAGRWTETEVNADTERFDNGSTTRAVLVDAVPQMLAEVIAAESQPSIERTLIKQLAAAVERVQTEVGQHGFNPRKRAVLRELYRTQSDVKKHMEQWT
jgi:hypothetical protein